MTTSKSLDDIFADESFGLDSTSVPAPPAKKATTATASSSTQIAAANGMLSGNQAVATQAATKLQTIEREINYQFVEREAEILSMIVGLIAGRHVLLLGPPGTGKSNLTYDFSSRVTGANYFQYLLNPTTDPSEILGPYDLTELKNGRFVRNPNGKLPKAHFAFLDEIYKGNSAALNILLPILNERIWYNDGQPVPAALQFAVGASNEEPQEENLAAFHDRFPFRHWVDYVRDTGNKAKMFRMNIDRRNPAAVSSQAKTTISLPEIEALRSFAQTVTIQDSVITEFQSVVFELEKSGIVISDRRQALCFELIQAHAAYQGRNVAMVDDFVCLIPVLWQRKDDFTKVEGEILKRANPFEEKLKKALSQASEMYDKVKNNTNPADRANDAINAREQLLKIGKTVDKLISEAKSSGRDTTKLLNGKAQIQTMHEDIINNVLLMTSSTDEEDMPF